MWEDFSTSLHFFRNNIRCVITLRLYFSHAGITFIFMKKLLCLFIVVLLFSFRGKTNDCDNLAKIVYTPEFGKHFNLTNKSNNVITIYSDLNQSKLCDKLEISNGKTIVFVKLNFEVKLNENSKGEVTNPRIVVSKQNNEYHFFETETNLKFKASVKKGKVVGISYGVF